MQSRTARWIRYFFRLPVWLVCRVLFRLEVRGAGRIPPDGAVVVVANHPTYLDPGTVTLSLLTRPVFFVAWDAIFRWPVLGWLARVFSAIEVDLDAPGHQTVRQSHRVLEAGLMLGVFPEGGRSDHPDRPVSPFKRGGFHLARRHRAWILPVIVYGGPGVWPLERGYPLPNKLRVQVLEPYRLAPPQDPPPEGWKAWEEEQARALEERFCRRLQAWEKLRRRYLSLPWWRRLLPCWGSSSRRPSGSSP